VTALLATFRLGVAPDRLPLAVAEGPAPGFRSGERQLDVVGHLRRGFRECRTHLRFRPVGANVGGRFTRTSRGHFGKPDQTVS
jgi:hypothetical protein